MKRTTLNEGLKELQKFLNKFPDDTDSWRWATDEVRDIARSAREFYNELNKNGDIAKPLDFREFQTPSEWNTKGKAFIFAVYNKMDNDTKEQFDKWVYNHFINPR